MALARAWTLPESREKLEARKMLEKAVESPASSTRGVSPFWIGNELCFFIL
jgi:hypothetical protein